MAPVVPLGTGYDGWKLLKSGREHKRVTERLWFFFPDGTRAKGLPTTDGHKEVGDDRSKVSDAYCAKFPQ